MQLDEEPWRRKIASRTSQHPCSICTHGWSTLAAACSSKALRDGATPRSKAHSCSSPMAISAAEESVLCSIVVIRLTSGCAIACIAGNMCTNFICEMTKASAAIKSTRSADVSCS